MSKRYNISKIPSTPGVYFFTDKSGKVLYIGKAKNLRNRLRGHPMLDKADKLEWQECGSEIEALILESRLIKKYKPPFNISMRDDKNYVYVQITHDEFPKIFVAHRSGIGPFTSSSELRATLKALRKLFPYCTCKQKHERPCLNAHIGKCLGYCCLKVSGLKFKVKYNNNIKNIKQILSGNKISIIKKFPRTFENIKVIKEISGRDSAISKLMKLMQLTKLVRIEAYDISNIQGKFAVGSMIVFENGYPNTGEYRKFKIVAPSEPNDILMLREMLSRRFAHADWSKPDLILIDGGRAQLNAARSAILNFKFSILNKVPILALAKGKNELFSSTFSKPISLKSLDLNMQNLIFHLDSEAHRFAISYYRLLHKKAVSGTMYTDDKDN